MLEGYPRAATLKDGAVITLRLTTRDDEYDLSRFFASLPEEATRYLRNDVTDRKIIARFPVYGLKKILVRAVSMEFLE